MFQFIPYAWIIYVSALIIQNAILAANDKAVLSIGFLTRWWFIAAIFLLTILLEMAFEFYRKKLEDI